MKRFYCGNLRGDRAVIRGADVAHIKKVLRFSCGDPLIVLDGKGREAEGKIAEIHPDHIVVALTSEIEKVPECSVSVAIYQSMIKNDHLDYVVQKCTEAGAKDFIFFTSSRCVRRPKEDRVEKLLARESRIALESSKQCRRAYIPNVEGILSFEEVVRRVQSMPGLFLFANESEKAVTIKAVLRSLPKDPGNIAVIIGPEGGFSTDEAREVADAGAFSCSLGKNIYRAETAGIVACAMINYEYMETL